MERKEQGAQPLHSCKHAATVASMGWLRSEEERSQPPEGALGSQPRRWFEVEAQEPSPDDVSHADAVMEGGGAGRGE